MPRKNKTEADTLSATETPRPPRPDAEPAPPLPAKPPLRRKVAAWVVAVLLLACAVWAVLYGVGALLKHPTLAESQSLPPAASVVDGSALPAVVSSQMASLPQSAMNTAPLPGSGASASGLEPEVELPWNAAIEDGVVANAMQQRITDALQQDGTERTLSFVTQPLDESALARIAGDNFTYAAWEGTPALGSAAILAWGVLGDASGTLPDNAPAGLGGEDLYAVAGLSIDGASIVLLDADRLPFSIPKQDFFTRVNQAGFYVRVDAVKIDVPYLSQLDADLIHGCEVTSMAMMMSHALGLTDDPLSPADMAAQMTYSTDGTPATGFVGSPTTTDSWTTYVEPQMDFVAGVIGSAVNLTNYTYPGMAATGQNASSLARVRATLAQGIPVVAWLSGYSQGWADYETLGITHCVVLTGFGADGFTLHDPYRYNPEQNYSHLHFPSTDIYNWMSAHDFRAMAY
ncbi:MAG: C39 family peptidase [Ruminococcaceae bacterium]|nr:C39 family peptidase [Oscillospiraceae bacterium]